MMHEPDISYATSDVDGNQLPHSIVSQTEVYSSPAANVTIACPSNTQTRLPSITEPDAVVEKS